MNKLVSFSDIDPDDDDASWTPEQIEAAEFLHKMDWEGGLDSLYQYGGSSYFPVELQELATAYGEAFDALRKAVDAWAADRGVVY